LTQGVKKILGSLASLLFILAACPASAQVAVGRPGASHAGPSVTLTVPSYTGIDLGASSQGTVRPVSRGRREAGDLVLSVAGNGGGPLYVSRVVVGQRQAAGTVVPASLRTSAAGQNLPPTVSSRAIEVAGSGWRSATQDLSSLFGPAVRRTANGGAAEPEIVIYEVGSF
jgi:hypothetical protein